VVDAEFSGNPDLQPDEGESFLLGVAWQPAFAPGLELAIDFWQIEHNNRILNMLMIEGYDVLIRSLCMDAPVL
jgi:iron complex outermembrane receptor protein